MSVDLLVDNNELNISVQLCYSILRGVILIESNQSDRFSFESIQRFGIASLIPWIPTRSIQVKLIDDSFVLTGDHIIITSSWRSYRGMEHTAYYVEFFSYKIDWVVTMDKIWEIVLAMWSISTTILITLTNKQTNKQKVAYSNHTLRSLLTDYKGITDDSLVLFVIANHRSLSKFGETCLWQCNACDLITDNGIIAISEKYHTLKLVR